MKTSTESKTGWVMNYPKHGKKTFFIAGKIARSEVVPRESQSPVLQITRPMIINMTAKEIKEHRRQPVLSI